MKLKLLQVTIYVNSTVESGVLALEYDAWYRHVTGNRKARFPLPELTARVNGPS